MSRVYDANGEIIACAKAFEEQNFVVDLMEKNEINEAPVDFENYKKQEIFSFDYEKDHPTLPSIICFRCREGTMGQQPHRKHVHRQL